MSEAPDNAELSFWGRLGRAFGVLFRALLRVLLVLILGAALGIGIYAGAIALYQQYITPVQVHAIRLDILDGQQAQERERVAGRLDDLQGRLQSLERAGDGNREAFDALNTRLATAEAAQAAQAAALDEMAALAADMDTLRAGLDALATAQETARADLETAREALTALGGTQSADQQSIAALAADLAAVDAALEALTTDLDGLQTQAEELSTTTADQGASLDALRAQWSGARSPDALLRELDVVVVLELLTRSRLLLVQNNLGLAGTDIEAARARLVDLASEGPETQAAAIAAVIARLDAALAALPGAPVAAADELEGAWQLLIAGLPAVEGAQEAAGTPGAETTPAAETTPEPEATPEAETTPEPEATPTSQP